jgi:hypothetical protein
VSLLCCAFPLAAQAGVSFAHIGDRVWEDINGDMIQDFDEPGIPNVTVILEDSSMSPVASQTTDANGNYQFFDLLTGDYKVLVDISTLPGGVLWNNTTPTDYPITLDPGETYLLADFGFKESTQTAPIPEPSTMLLFGSGLASLAAWRYRKRVKP